ncbi:N-acetyltransferase family protein [Spirillospora sp. CA-142024]|uniref:GNAT family N-acetyltransferase n=1 Tax=Spirillospora sp. CA-142024 TaxID=3240036 RepID=UPI003D8EDE6B
MLEATDSAMIVGLFELSLAIVAEDVARYRAAGVHLTEANDCRFGPTLADAFQGRQAGTLAFPLITDVVRKLGRTRIILWGGVLADNARAIRFYEKNGFRHIGSFTGPDGLRSLDMMLDLGSRPG